MSMINRILLLVIFCLAILNELEVCQAQPHQFLGAQINCKELCDQRCSLASRYRMCIRTCNTCCQRCNCVPPGTSGNAETCPCWANMTTTSGKKKCP